MVLCWKIVFKLLNSKLLLDLVIVFLGKLLREVKIFIYIENYIFKYYLFIII